MGRQRTVWTRITLSTFNADQTDWYIVKRYREAGDRSTSSYNQYPLYDPLKLQEALADGLLRRFEEHPQYAEIRTGIDLLLTSREKAIVFGSHRFISAFTAFETVINAYSEAGKFDKAITGKRERRLLSQVRNLVEQFSSAEGLPSWVVEAVQEKAPELTRVSFIRRAWQTGRHSVGC